MGGWSVAIEAREDSIAGQPDDSGTWGYRDRGWRTNRTAGFVE